MGRDYGLILGELGRTAPHAHYAHQLMVCPSAPITVSLEGHVTTAHRLFIPSRQTHAIIDAILLGQRIEQTAQLLEIIKGELSCAG